MLAAVRCPPVLLLLVSIATFTPTTSLGAQSPGGQATSSPPEPNATQPPRLTLPTITVTAQKEPRDLQQAPLSATVVSKETLWNAGISQLSDAAIFAPNTYFTEFSARKLSTSRFRGIGSSPANPGVTTYIDGVPQLNTNSSSIEFLDVEQVELVRGPQSALFGRNTLGGLVNISSVRPSTDRWRGSLSVPIGNFGARDIRGGASGPIGEALAASVAFGYGERDGFTRNLVTGNDVDFRSATFFKGQVLWTPNETWDARVVVTGERARDGDYALNDLAALRSRPYQTARDFEGSTERDVLGTTVIAQRRSDRFVLTSTTGLLRWDTADQTDLDYSPLPLITRSNVEADFQFTQEVRLASAPQAAVQLADNLPLRWQGGVFFFTQAYEQEAVNTFAPFVLSPLVPLAVRQTSPAAQLDDVGFSAYGQGTVTLADRLDLSAGARLDRESKEAQIVTSFSPALSSSLSVDADRSFTAVSPQFGATYRLLPEHALYGTFGRGFKAGGFNPVSLPGDEAYEEEFTWNLEGGVKSSWAEGRISTSVAAFRLAWDDLQLNLPVPAAPASFYIANVGNATSTGIEADATARLVAGLDAFAAFGYTRARFGDGTISSGLEVSDRRLPNTPDYTATFGAQLSRALTSALTLYGRGEAVFYGDFFYDDLNTASQESYGIANFRAGVRSRLFFAEAWVRNAFDTFYIPVAFAYGPLAPSGFVGESGRPRTFGINGGITF